MLDLGQPVNDDIVIAWSFKVESVIIRIDNI